MTAQSAWIKDTSAATFEADVIEASRERPVVVDLWAPWCGPCRQLGPLLEQLAEEYAGKFHLVKLDVDANPELAGMFGVQSIPFVVAFSDAQPVDQFLGVLPLEELRAWLDRILPSPAAELLKQGQKLESTDPQAAEAAYREALELEPDDDAIKIRLARVLLHQHREDECRAIVERLEARGWLEPEAERIKSELELLAAAEEAGPLDEARRAAAAAPDDLELQLKLADALAAGHKYEEALELCLSLIERDKAGIGPRAKDTMVQVFDVLGPASELVGTYRRKLSTAWY